MGVGVLQELLVHSESADIERAQIIMHKRLIHLMWN